MADQPVRNTSLRRAWPWPRWPAWRSCSPRGPAEVEPATLVLHKGTIVTVDDAKPEAQALAARGDTIVAVGTNEEIAAYVGPQTRVVDLAGRLAIPGFIEGHGHFTGRRRGADRAEPDDASRTGTRSWPWSRRPRPRPAPATWIRGRGWHQEKWDKQPEPAVEGFPTHHSLSAVSPDNPVVLGHASGHASFANAKAMELAGSHARRPRTRRAARS